MTRRKHRPRRSEDAAEGPGGSLWLYGQHAVAAALANPERSVKRLLVAEPPASVPEGRPAPEVVERRAIERLLPAGAVHQGIAAEVLPLAPAALDQVLARIEKNA